MPNLEWGVAHSLEGPLGTLALNQTEAVTGRRYQILSGGYKIVPSLRVVQDNLSQTDGAQLHPRWKTGLVATMTIRYQINGQGVPDYVPACGEDLRVMHEMLMRQLDSIRHLSPTADQRLHWTPTGAGDRMLTEVQTLTWADPVWNDDGTTVTFALETPFPYAIDLTEINTPIAAGATAVITNNGSSEIRPVIEIIASGSPISTFTIVNTGVLDELGNPLEIRYDASLPGAHVIAAGHFLEIDLFKGTATLDGDVDGTYIAGIDASLSDFFPLAVGANPITILGAAGIVKWNPAWS